VLCKWNDSYLIFPTSNLAIISGGLGRLAENKQNINIIFSSTGQDHQKIDEVLVSILYTKS